MTLSLKQYSFVTCRSSVDLPTDEGNQCSDCSGCNAANLISATHMNNAQVKKSVQAWTTYGYPAVCCKLNSRYESVTFTVIALQI